MVISDYFWIFFYFWSLKKLDLQHNVLLFFFNLKVLFLLSQVIITLNIYIFYVFKGHFCCVTTLYIFGCFLLFRSPRPPRISNFHLASLLQLIQPSNYFDIKKKNCALGVLRYGLGWKQPRLVILATYISCLGTKICPN